ncbi:MAG: glycerophosphodiester phosphodiesterase [bacterium]
MIDRRRFIQTLLASATGLASSNVAVSAVTDSVPLANKLVIAHRGASGYLPEHSLEAKAMAYAQGADYLEQDVVLSRDGQAMVLHDLTLDAVTDVAKKYPGRARQDGRFYVIDFDLQELNNLSMHERIDPRSGRSRFPDRFPQDRKPFRVHTLEQEIDLIQGLNHSTGRTVGIYVELKDPLFHATNNMDVTDTVIHILHKYGYRTADDSAYIQCFDSLTLEKTHDQKLTGIPLVQLIGENRWWPDSQTDYDFLKTADGLNEIAKYASGIGPWYRQIYLGLNKDNVAEYSTLVRDAHKAGLAVHPYTLRADQYPEEFSSFEELLNAMLVMQKVDGVFTDHTDRVRHFIDQSKQLSEN